MSNSYRFLVDLEEVVISSKSFVLKLHKAGNEDATAESDGMERILPNTRLRARTLSVAMVERSWVLIRSHDR